jgi:GntR family transcriptional regulator
VSLHFARFRSAQRGSVKKLKNRALLQGRPQAQVAPRSAIPLYQSLVEVLRKEILDGVHPVGSALPTEEDLQQRFSVSRFTVREAIRRLRETGLVRSRRGTPAVVLPSSTSESFVHHSASINDLVALAATTRFQVDTVKLIKIDANMSPKLRLPFGTEWLFAAGSRHANGIDPPVAAAQYYVNREFAAIGRLLHAHNGPIFSLIESMFAVSIVEVEQQIAAFTLPQTLAERFQVNPELAALEIMRTFRLEDGKIAQVTLNVYPASRFRHLMTMRRMKA